MTLLCCCKFPLCPLFGEFYHKWVLNFFKSFLCTHWNDHIFLFQSLLIWHSQLILCILKSPCSLGINSTWSWCMIFLICCWILYANILLKIFTFFLNWRIISLQNCFLSNLNKNQPLVHIYPLPFETLSHLLAYPTLRLIQSPCLSFLSHTANSHWISLLHMVM